jgi:CheY-like chemotaxis protein
MAASQPYEYAAILMDLRMPVMGGIEAASRIRRLDRPDAKTIPILALTADANSTDVKNCREAGMNGHIAKPIDAKILFAELARVLKEHN